MAMRRHLVQDLMTPDPVTICPTTTLPEAYRLMKGCGVRRLPVVDNGCLVGIVTLRDVREATPLGSAPLNLYETTFELARLTIGEIMAHNPISVAPNTSVEAAAHLMLEHKISGVPVVDGSRLVGILTESGIFRLLVTESEMRYSFA